MTWDLRSSVPRGGPGAAAEARLPEGVTSPETRWGPGTVSTTKTENRTIFWNGPEQEFCSQSRKKIVSMVFPK